MENNHSPAMSQEIFSLCLDTQTVSVYLMCCGLVDAGETLSGKNLQRIWNGTREALLVGLKKLEERRIIHRTILDDTTNGVYRLTAESQWRSLKTGSAS